MDDRLFIVGAGGFGKEVLCCYMDMQRALNLEIDVCFIVEDKYFKTNSILGEEVIPLSSFSPEMGEVIIAIGDPTVRRRLVATLPSSTKFATIIHPTAVVSEWVEIGEGSILTAGVILTVDITVGKHSHLNLKTSIGHDCKIGDFFTSAPGVSISGKCDIGDAVYFGTNSSLKHGLNVCDNVTIGMGAVVVKSISEPGVYIGNPARKLAK